MKRLRGFLAREDGASAVEFSLVITSFCLVLFGAAEYGWYMWTANVLQQTALQTARCMGILQSDCAPARTFSASSTTAYAQRLASGYGVSLPTSGVDLITSATCGGASDLSQVTISYTFRSSAPLLVPGLSTQPLSATACFPNQS